MGAGRDRRHNMLRSSLAALANNRHRYEIGVVTQDNSIHYTAVIGKNVNIGTDVVINAFVVIDDGARIGDGVEIGHHVSIGPHTRIGSGTVILPHVTIRERIRIGRNVTINSGAIIGSDGFGFANNSGINHKIPQVGTVEIEDNVWIGSNVTIDRATIGATRVRRGARIDNLVQIGHNVEVGEETVIRPQVGIAGSTVIGSESYVGDKAGIIGHIEIGNNVTIHPFSGITKGVNDGQSVMGTPARPFEMEKSIQVLVQDLPDMLRELQQLRRQLADKENADKQ
jgi:UDP-3-O-[3-hydroxymyristoyl] glucosamine N-acyltransferase